MTDSDEDYTVAIVLGAIGGVILLMILWCCITNHMIMSKKKAEYFSQGLLAQTAVGQVEYSIKGKAPYILALHGTPGSHDGVYGDNDKWLPKGFGVICPSRAGYGRSYTGRRYPEQADACIALLDTLGVNEVCVFAVSGGGPCAINVCAKYPDRVKGLVLEAANSGDWDEHRRHAWKSCCFKMVTRATCTARLLGWLSKKYSAWFYENIMLPDLSTFTPEELKQQAEQTKDPNFNYSAVHGFGENVWLMGVYPQTFEVAKIEMDEWIEPQPLEQVKCPTKIYHGTKDADPITHSTQSHEKIKGSTLRLLEGGWHVLDVHPEWQNMFDEQAEFFHQCFKS